MTRELATPGDPVPVDVDVAIVGAGPTGAFAANLCGRYGLSAVALERATEIHDLPRAVALWDDVARILDSAGLFEPLRPQTCIHAGGEFVDSQGKRLIGFDLPEGLITLNGHPPVRGFHQPDLERVLRAGIRRFPAVALRPSCEVVGFEQESEHVSLVLQDGATPATLRARWLIGCDGAASFVRRACGIGWESLGYDREWLVVDALVDPGVTLTGHTVQVCDPARLVTLVPGPGRLRRWEIALLPGESRREMEAPGQVAALLAPWVQPDQVEIVRAVVYRFHATVADSFRNGRVFLAGDAAHQTPPFLGQGLCSGLRDADNLIWKLAQVKRYGADEALLDSYSAERQPMAAAMVRHAVNAGLAIETYAAMERGGPPPSAELRAYAYGGSAQLPTLRTGWLEIDGVKASRWIGERIPCGRVHCGDRDGDFDQVVGPRWALVSASDPTGGLRADERLAFERLGAAFVSALEPTGALLALLLEHPTVIVRPDHIVYGVRA